MCAVSLLRAERLGNSGVHLRLSTSLLPAPRPRLSKHGAYLPAQYRKYRDALAGELAKHIPSDKQNYAICITVYRDYDVLDNRYGDVDNLAKTVMDALPFDDARVVSISITKRTGKPCVLLTVKWVSENGTIATVDTGTD